MPAARSLNRPSASGAAVVISSTYEDLLRDVRSALFTGRANIEYAWLMMFHDVGRFIHTHLLGHQDRAGYAAKTFARLAADTDVSKRVLYEWVQFFRCFPIVRPGAQLTRTHYRLLVEKFRLHGIDCPEMSTAEGKAAKRFVDRLMSDVEEITVATSKVDKFDRYLADVHLRLRSGDEVFLNNALLENGHAVRMDGAHQDDWTP